jgi:outer membrane protein OmpA-like peptidoglycan-associated protein
MKTLPFVMFTLLLVATPVFAQSPDDPDAEGCKDSKLLTRMSGCRIDECSARDFDSAKVQVKAGEMDSPGVAKALEGVVEEITYLCPARLSLLQLQRNAESALKAGGFSVVYSGKDENDWPMVTTRKGGQWVEVRARPYNEFTAYKLTAVLEKAMTQEMQADASAMAESVIKSGSVAVYGINFDTGKATLQAGSDEVLNEVAKLLKEHGEWRFEVQGHTDNVGAKAANLTLSEQRAQAVVAWLTAHGIEASRLVAKGYGDSTPVADNTSDDGRAKNRRVELKKLNEE